MYWANFLHIYQPPTQTLEIIEKVTNECYRKLVKILKENSGGKITLNINACLTERLYKCGFKDVIEGLKELAENGQIEFTATAKYHPILPLLPDEEIVRQIELNCETNEKYFGSIYKPRGFFPPEMCYSRNLARIVKELGYDWIIIDEIGYNGRLGQLKKDVLYTISEFEPFKVFFRERKVSSEIAYKGIQDLRQFKELNYEILSQERYLLTGTDGEIYGHHRLGQEKLLEEAFKDLEIKICTISELENIFSAVEVVDPKECSWSTWEDEMSEDVPFPKWSYPGNTIHNLQWKLTEAVIDVLKEVPPSKPFYLEARDVLDQALHSCQWWWASCRPWWDTNMILKGTDLLLKVVDIIKGEIPEDMFNNLKDMGEEIKHTAVSWYESGKSKRMQDDYLNLHKDMSLLTFGKIEQ